MQSLDPDGWLKTRMTTDTEAGSLTTAEGAERSSASRLASLFHRYMPVWRTVYVLLEQVASLRHQLDEAQRSLILANQRIDEAATHANQRTDEVCLRVDQAHQRILKGEEQIAEAELRADLLHGDLERSGVHLRDLEARLQLAWRRAGQSDSDLSLVDSFYQHLQAQHRGEPETVVKLQKSYAAHFNDRGWLRAAGSIIDLGCGRGEWLSLMADEGWTVRGVDSSEQAVREARELGLDVELGDLVDFLEACPADSISGVTAFQVIEHLPFGRLAALVHAAFRALVPGGILLLETPNPENLQVSSYGFWLDPTHRHPIPPPLIMDLTSHMGFRDGSCLRKNPWPQWREHASETALESEVAYRLFGPQDYAILAYKPTLADQ